MCTETLNLYKCGHILGGSSRRRIQPCSRAQRNACARVHVQEKRHTTFACPECRGTKVDGLAARLQQSAAERVKVSRAASGRSNSSSSGGSEAGYGGRRY